MIVGVLICELFIPQSRSLKDKRQVIKSLINKTQKNFNISIVELDHHELWQRATLGLSSISNSQKAIEKVFNQVENLFEESDEVIITKRERNFFSS